MGAGHAIQQQLVETRHDTHAHVTLASVGGMGLHDRSKHHVCKLLSGHYDLFPAVRLSLVCRGIYKLRNPHRLDIPFTTTKEHVVFGSLSWVGVRHWAASISSGGLRGRRSRELPLVAKGVQNINGGPKSVANLNAEC